MIRTIIFDFGDVFINLDKKGALKNAVDLFKIEALTDDLIKTNSLYETGKISTRSFIEFYHEKFPNCSKEEIIHAWNYIIKDFPTYRFDFLKNLYDSNAYNLILLSNTNEMHIDFIKDGIEFFDEFKSCFHRFYLSHEIEIRKPDQEIFELVLSKDNLLAEECLFIDDTQENTDAARKLGIHTWNIDETSEDVIDLFTIKASLF